MDSTYHREEVNMDWDNSYGFWGWGDESWGEQGGSKGVTNEYCDTNSIYEHPDWGPSSSSTAVEMQNIGGPNTEEELNQSPGDHIIFHFNDWASIRRQINEVTEDKRPLHYQELVRQAHHFYSGLTSEEMEKKLNELGEYLNAAPTSGTEPKPIGIEPKKKVVRKKSIKKQIPVTNREKEKPTSFPKPKASKYHTRLRTFETLFQHGSSHNNAIDLESSDEYDDVNQEYLDAMDEEYKEESSENDILKKYKFKTEPKQIVDKATHKIKYMCQIPGCKCPPSNRHNIQQHINGHLKYIREKLEGKRPHGNQLHRTLPRQVAEDLKKMNRHKPRRKDVVNDDNSDEHTPKRGAPGIPSSPASPNKVNDMVTKILAQIMRGAEAKSRESGPLHGFFGIGEESSHSNLLPEDEYVRPHHNMAAFARSVAESIDRLAKGETIEDDIKEPETWMEGDHFSKDGQEYIRRMASKPHYESDSLAKSDVFTLRKYIQFCILMEEDPQIPMSNGQLKRFFMFLAYYSHLALPTMETVIYHGLLRLGFAGDYSSESTFRSVCHGIWNDLRHDDKVKQSGPGNHPLTPVTWRCVLDRVRDHSTQFLQTVSFISFCISTACRGDSTRRVRFQDLLGYEKRRDGRVLLRVNIPRSKTHYRDNSVRTIGGWPNSPDPTDPIRAISEYFMAQFRMSLEEVTTRHINEGVHKTKWKLADGTEVDGNTIIWNVNLNNMTDRLKRLLSSAGFRDLRGWGVHSCRSGWLTGLFEMNDKPGKMRAIMEHGAVLAGWKANSQVEFGYVKDAVKQKTDMAFQIDMGTVPPIGIEIDLYKDEVHTIEEYDSKYEIAKRLRMTESLHQVKLAEPKNPRVPVPENYETIQIRKPGQVEHILCKLDQTWLRPKLITYFNCHEELVRRLERNEDFQRCSTEEKEEAKVALALQMLEALYPDTRTRVVIDEIIQAGSKAHQVIEEEGTQIERIWDGHKEEDDDILNEGI